MVDNLETNPYLQTFDYLAILQNDRIKKQLLHYPSEIVYYSKNMQKINKREQYQTRIILVTNFGIYNVDNNKVKRKIEINLVEALTISKQSEEFIIHIKDQYDYRYTSEPGQREIVLNQIMLAYQAIVNSQIPLYFIEEPKLLFYCAQEDDFKKDQKINKIPRNIQPEFQGNQKINMFFSNKLLKQKDQQVLFINSDNYLRVCLEDFKLMKILAEGSYSIIYLVHHKDDFQNRFCLKIIKEELIIGKKQNENFISQIKNHKNGSFIEKLEFAFKNKNQYLFLFEVYKGSDLLNLLNEQIKFTEEQLKFYFAQIFLGIKKFHENNIIYGDLKPENILIDSNGSLALTDYGFCRINNSNTTDVDDEIELTLDYASPEILQGKPRSFESDYWALGCILYEIVVGITPFYHENQDLLVHLILQNKITYPKKQENSEIDISDECKDLIEKLLQTEPEKRINYQGVYHHPWLNTIDWHRLEKNQINNKLPAKMWKPEQKLDDKGKSQFLNYNYFKDLKPINNQGISLDQYQF